jgi:hypothetical protein
MVASPGRKTACQPEAEEAGFGASYCCYALQNYLAPDHDCPSCHGHLDSSGLVWIRKDCPLWTGFFVDDSSFCWMTQVRRLLTVVVSSAHVLSMAIALFARCQVSAFYRVVVANCGLEDCEIVDAEIAIVIVIVYQSCEVAISILIYHAADETECRNRTKEFANDGQDVSLCSAKTDETRMLDQYPQVVYLWALTGLDCNCLCDGEGNDHCEPVRDCVFVCVSVIS